MKKLAVAASLLAMMASAGRAHAEVYAVPDGARVLSVGVEHMRGRMSAVRLTALRGETAAFQLVYEPRGSDAPPPDAVVPMPLVVESQGASLLGKVYVERFVDVKARSRNDRGEDALGFTKKAMLPDEGELGLVPDALLTPEQALKLARIDHADPAYVSPPRGVYYAEVTIPDDAAAGTYTGSVVLVRPNGYVGSIDVTIRVLDATLPYRPVRMHTYYERSTLENWFDDPDLAERDLVRMLHAHHLDALTQITRPEDVDRVRGALDGSWFDGDYAGPGRGVPTSIVALGAYGTFRDPGAGPFAAVRALAPMIPQSVDDLFVYAVDESCDSPRGPRWRAWLRDENLHPRVKAGHTCERDPAEQDVDIAMIPAQAFDPETARAARAQGKAVWIYNGMLPFTGAMVLDVPPTSLTVDGWIAATFDVGRWFFWESIFWEDHNRGGTGPSDVFVNPETFHNADGDTSLYDGMLVYPGRMPHAIGKHDLGFDGVVPSLRLEALRRGIEDAGLIALAAQVDADKTNAIVSRVVGPVLDEVTAADPVRFELGARPLADARAELHAIIGGARKAPSIAPTDLDRALGRVRDARQDEREWTRRGQGPTESARTLVLVGVPLALLGWGLVWAAVLGRRRLSARAAP